MANNTSYFGGVGNISINDTAVDPMTVNETTSKIGDTFVVSLAGSEAYAGILGLIVVGSLLWRADAPADVQVTVMIPLVLLFASKSLIPYGQAIFYGTLAIVAVSAVAGFFKYWDR